MANDFILAADVGGTHLTAALVDVHARKLVASSLVRTHVNAAGSATEIIQSWSGCLTRAKGDAEVAKICLAMPGPFDYTEGISLMKDQGKYGAFYEENVTVLLAGAMQVDATHFFFENDAACFLHGEVFAGCAKGFDKVVGVTLGTGLGTAVYDNGRSRSADLWSAPFLDGVAEDYLSTRWFLQQYEAKTGEQIGGVKELVQVPNGAVIAKEIFHGFGKSLAAFLQFFIQKETPQAVVIGGNISNAYLFFQTALEETLSQRFPFVAVKKSLLGEQAALLGAAGSWHSAVQKT